jgi:Ca2+-transporting ATPase
MATSHGDLTSRLGLTSQEAAARLDRDGPNELPANPEPSLLARFVRQALEPLSLVLVAASVISVVVLEQVVEGLAIFVIVVLNVTVGSVQEARSASALAALEDLTAPTARTRRDGRIQVVPARALVVGDLVELAAGDRVPADLSLLEVSGLSIDEAILTGESFPVDKGPVTDGDGASALAGTLVVRGRGLGEVDATGAATRLGAIATALERPTEPPLVGELEGVAKRMSLLAIGLACGLIPLLTWRSADGPDAFSTAVLAAVALAVAAIPEGLATVVVTSLALGARRMAQRGAIVRQLVAIEALGSTTVLCTDKTGTLTTGRLAVREAIPAAGREGALWRAALRCNDSLQGTGDPIDVALHDAAVAAGGGHQFERVADRPFDASTRAMSTIDLVDGVLVLTVKGAPEDVLARCAPGPEVDQLHRLALDLASNGLRVLALAAAATDDLDETDLDALGIVAFHDPLRPSAVEAVEACARAGMRLVLVTGDHAATARAVAESVGITGEVVSGDELAGVDAELRAAALRSAAVVARVDPATKLDLVDAHRATGAIVAMTGDGVNDAPALRRADVGVAIAGDGGTDVARQAADVVVTNGDLGTIVAAVGEGRQIYRNLQSVVSYLVTGNLSEVLVFVASLVLLPDLALPLLPVQLLWVNLMTDGLPALALGVDRARTDPLLDPPTDRSQGLLGRDHLVRFAARGAVLAVAVILAGLIALQWGWTDRQVRTQLLLTLLVAHLLLVFVVRARRFTFEAGWWANGSLDLAVGGSLVLQVIVFVTPIGRSVLSLAALPAAGWVLATLLPIAVVAVVDLVRRA